MSSREPDVPITEQENPRTKNLSSFSSLEIVRVMNEEDAMVAAAVAAVAPEISQAVDRSAFEELANEIGEQDASETLNVFVNDRGRFGHIHVEYRRF